MPLRRHAEGHRALLVGDSPHDIAAGKAAGIDTAACLWGPFDRHHIDQEKPTWWLESFADLIRICEL